MKTKISLHKLIINGCIFGQAALFAGCDSEELDLSEAADQNFVSNNRTVEDDVSNDEFEISLDEDLNEPLNDLTSLPRPAAGFCDGYNGWNYCYAKCGDGQWKLVGHASVIPYGSCTSEGDKRCGGWWNHFGSCWGNG